MGVTKERRRWRRDEHILRPRYTRSVCVCTGIVGRQRGGLFGCRCPAATPAGPCLTVTPNTQTLQVTQNSLSPCARAHNLIKMFLCVSVSWRSSKMSFIQRGWCQQEPSSHHTKALNKRTRAQLSKASTTQAKHQTSFSYEDGSLSVFEALPIEDFFTCRDLSGSLCMMLCPMLSMCCLTKKACLGGSIGPLPSSFQSLRKWLKLFCYTAAHRLCFTHIDVL